MPFILSQFTRKAKKRTREREAKETENGEDDSKKLFRLDIALSWKKIELWLLCGVFRFIETDKFCGDNERTKRQTSTSITFIKMKWFFLLFVRMKVQPSGRCKSRRKEAKNHVLQ